MRARFEVADVLRKVDPDLSKIPINAWQLRTLYAIKKCRTAELGGHIDRCSDCHKKYISYNSCRNRHCPKCQGHLREKWIGDRTKELLAVPYFHVVFTLPSELNGLAMQFPKEVYDSLFTAAWQTLCQFGNDKTKDLGLQLGMIAVLHTWGQNLSLHPHLHCIVPGGGITPNGNWKNVRKDGKFLFSVKAMSKVFRAKYVADLSSKIELEKPLREVLFSKPWVVFAKRPFGSPKSVIEYLGRYTHKIAISNHRIQSIDDEGVVFQFKDYKDGAKKKTMRLTHVEFLRRFALHILPKRFVKIRQYGFLSSTWKREKLKQLQKQFTVTLPNEAPKSVHRKCPCCKVGTLITIEVFGKRGPPSALPSSVCQPIVSCEK